MHVRLLFFLTLVAASALTSCAGTRYVAHHTTAREVRDVALVEPLAYIGHIDQGNRIEPSDSLSSVTARLLDSVALAQNQRLPITGSIALADEGTASPPRVLADAPSLRRLYLPG